MKRNYSGVDPLYFQLFQVQPRKGELRKLKIVKCAISCIAEMGIEKTTFESIGRMARMHKAHVAYHFPDKGKIIEHAIRYITTVAQQITVERVKGASEPREQVLAVVDGAFDWCKRHPEHLSVMLLFYCLCTHDEVYRKLNTEIRGIGTKRIATALMQSPQLRSLTEASAERLAREVQAIITGRLIERFSTADRTSLTVLKNEVRNAVVRLLAERQGSAS